MVLIHFVLIYGTNNVQTEGYDFTAEQLYHRSVGARLVLAARIFYAAFIWLSKWTVSEFLKRMTLSLWRRSYEWTLQCIRGFLVFTFIAVIIATLAECQPFDHYWQVVPDPGPKCRQGFAQLLTMGTADIITDILLIAFPIPIVLRSGQHWTRKLLLLVLFSCSIILIVITAFRMPEVIAAGGRQQYRTIWASSEIIASTFVSNFIIIGSFLRDKGTKKNKYRATSVSDSIDRPSTRRPTVVALQSLGSDEELFRTLGCRLPDHLQGPKEDKLPRPAPVAAAIMTGPYSDQEEKDTTKLNAYREPIEGESDMDDSDESLKQTVVGRVLPSPTPSSITKPGVSFFDVGGLLENGRDHSLESRSQESMLTTSHGSQTIARDWAPPSPSNTRHSSRHGTGAPPSPIQTRRGSRHDAVPSIVQPRNARYDNMSILAARIEADIESRRNSPQPPLFRSPPEGYHHASMSSLGPTIHRQGTDLSFQDAGGLLSSTAAASESSDNVAAPNFSRPRQSRGELQDIGGLLGSDERPMDASAAALHRRLHGGSTPRTQQIPSHSTYAGHHGQGADMMLGDAGGLLK